MMRVEIVIDELLLVGFDPRERHRLADALERELAAATVPREVLGLVKEGSAIAELAPIQAAIPADGRSSKPGMAAIARSVSAAIVAAIGPGGAAGGNARGAAGGTHGVTRGGPGGHGGSRGGPGGRP